MRTRAIFRTGWSSWACGRGMPCSTIHLATLTTGLAALLLYRVSDWSGAFLVVALVICTLAIIAILETVGPATKREREPLTAVTRPVGDTA